MGLKEGVILKALLICPRHNLAEELQSALGALPVAVLRYLEHYPPEEELVRLLRSLTPHAVLLGIDAPAEAVAVAKGVESHAPGVQVVALGQDPEPEVLIGMMRAGVREFLQFPIEARAVGEVVSRMLEVAERAPRSTDLTELVFSFLPSKAGVGASTVALNLSAALGQAPDTRVLLADFDLNSGLIAFMLKLDTPHSVGNAAENASRMDEDLWGQLVSTRGGLDVLPAGRIDVGHRIEPAQVRSLLLFARRRYTTVCLDLSGNLEKYSVEIMHESQRIFLVTTAELPALHLAREKLAFLRAVDLEDRVSIILNRVSKRDVVNTAEVEERLGLPVRSTFPNDYQGVHQAMASGGPVAPSSELGKRFRSEAEALLSKSKPQPDRKPRLVKYFSLLPKKSAA